MPKAPYQLKAERPKLKAFGITAKPSFMMALCFVLSAFGLSSCSFNPNYQGKGQPYLQGVWQQDSSTLQQKLVTAAQYHIKFDCDSFFMQIRQHSTVNYGNDSCMHNGRFSEYVKGTYYQRNDTLMIKGYFCNANFSYKLVAGCFRTGMYEEQFTISKKADTLIQLTGTSAVIPLNLHRTKQTSCTPKAL